MTYFTFEQDFVNSLRCIPMVVRWRLDICGIKLKLSEWQLFDLFDRQQLTELPFNTDQDKNVYHIYLCNLLETYTGARGQEIPIDPNPAWLEHNEIPSLVLDKLQEMNLKISLEQWQQLTPLQRFCLIKLSRSSHENKNFLPALQEFQLLSS